MRFVRHWLLLSFGLEIAVSVGWIALALASACVRLRACRVCVIVPFCDEFFALAFVLPRACARCTAKVACAALGNGGYAWMFVFVCVAVACLFWRVWFLLLLVHRRVPLLRSCVMLSLCIVVQAFGTAGRWAVRV